MLISSKVLLHILIVMIHSQVRLKDKQYAQFISKGFGCRSESMNLIS